MASCRVRISRSAEKALKKLPRDARERVVAAMVGLGENPFPPGVRKLSGYDDVFRIRVGNYRILHSVSERELIIIVLKIGHRGDLYR
ncbi:MAG TPA: type II toxin-antitoxin system RelE/ParE family toxin [Vicinamibacteria bacterium]|nr:type II toxin-antitoxin system RelE/ParE family toxin [Vicinamibacteria bacterium]